MTSGESEMQTRTQRVGAIIQTFQDLFMQGLSNDVANWVAFELTFAQLKGLLMLARHDSLTISQLAKLLGTGNPAASVLVQQLVGRGLVTRTEDASDRRRVVLRLNERGAALITGWLKERETQLQHWLNRLSDEELGSFVLGLKTMRDAVHAEMKQTGVTTAALTDVR